MSVSDSVSKRRYEVEGLQLKGKAPDELKEILQTAIWRLEQEKSLTSDAIDKVFRDLSARLDISLRDLSRPFYVAITGAKASTPLFQSMEILGLDIIRMRLRRAIEALGGISSKKMRALEKVYAASD